MVFHYFMGLAYQGQDIVFRFTTEYSNLRDLKVLTLEFVPTSKNKIYEE